LDAKTRALLRYAGKLTETPSLVNEEDVGLLANVGWNPQAIWQLTALVSFFNFTGRLEAASGLPPDQIPERATLAEARDN
jgi:alkylhydroperoxidase family enzyme